MARPLDRAPEAGGATQAELDAWSRVHAAVMVASPGGPPVLEQPCPGSCAGLLAFAILVVRGRRGGAAERRTAVPNLVTLLRVIIIASMTLVLHDAPGPWVAAV